MTPEQIKDLSDTELNRAIVWFYINDLPNWLKDSWIEDYGKNLCVDVGGDCDYGINFTTDWNLTMPLAVENKIELLPCNYKDGFWCVYCVIKSRNYSSVNKSPIRAICEVLVMIAMERNNAN